MKKIEYPFETVLFDENINTSDEVRDCKSLYSNRPDCKSARTGIAASKGYNVLYPFVYSTSVIPFIL